MWQKKELSYDVCVPPISKPFALLNSKETKEYFKWFINEIPERIQYLSKKISNECDANENRIDLSPESLSIVWKWFLGKARTEMGASNALQLDLQTEYIIRDIGMYMGELFNSHYDCISWNYFETPKTDFFVNRPVLIGFKDNSVSPPFDAIFEPIHMVRVQACKILFNRQSEDDLLNLYYKWAEKIVEIQ